MADETNTDRSEVEAIDQEASVEAKPSKKTKTAKKKAAEPQAEESPVTAEVVVAEAIPVAEAAQAEPVAPPDIVVISTGSTQLDRPDELFEQGVQALLRAEYDAADDFFGQALANSRKNGDQAGQVAALEQLGHLCYLRGAIPQAQDYYQQAGSLRGA